jgi:hypothetical protein
VLRLPTIWRRIAHETLENFPVRKAAFDSKLTALEVGAAERTHPSDEMSSSLSRLADEKTSLELFCTEYKKAKNLDERASLAVDSDGRVQSIQIQLRNAERQKKELYKPDATEEERETFRKTVTRVNRLRGVLGTAAAAPFEKAKERLRQIDIEIAARVRASDVLKQEIKKAERDLTLLEDSKVRSELLILNAPKFDFAGKNTELERFTDDLLGRGYTAVYLRQDAPKAIDVVRLLKEKSEIGQNIRNGSRGKDMSKILFLAANPMSTSRLDLEEELYRIDSELRAVKH